MKFRILIVMIIISQCLNAQNKPFKIKGLNNYIQEHKSFAILPFDVTVDANSKPAELSDEDIKAGELEKGIEMQTSFYAHLVKRLRRKDIEVQDIDQTNRILRKNGITIENYLDYEPGELAAILKVDGIFINKAKTTEPLTSKDRQKAMAINAATQIFTGLSLGPKSKANINSRLYDAKSGKLIWSWEYKVRGGISNADRAIESFIKEYVRISPYRKK